jgi:NAD(P)-dependent dehydrogenase (short-subunit alcohol dehydrogenase family)
MTTDVVIITGSSGGIGAALVDEFFGAGYQIIGLDIAFPGTSDAPILAEVRVDLCQYSNFEHYRQNINKEILAVLPKDMTSLIIINNAATQILAPMQSISQDNIWQSLSVNAVAPFFLVQGLIEVLKRNLGVVINVGSIHAKLTKKNFLAYSSSKACLDGITRAMAIELASDGIRVNGVSPAAIKTEMLVEGLSHTVGALNELEKYHPTNSIGTPAELAGFIRLIAEDVKIFATGSIFEFSGGITHRLHDPE